MLKTLYNYIEDNQPSRGDRRVSMWLEYMLPETEEDLRWFGYEIKWNDFGIMEQSFIMSRRSKTSNRLLDHSMGINAACLLPRHIQKRLGESMQKTAGLPDRIKATTTEDNIVAKNLF